MVATIAEEDGRYYNRLLWVRPDGSYEKYDKRHLFTLAGEHEHYALGHQRLIVTPPHRRRARLGAAGVRGA